MKCPTVVFVFSMFLLLVGTPRSFALGLLLPREKTPEIPADINPEIKKIIEMMYTENWNSALGMMISNPDHGTAAPVVPFALDRLRDVNPKWKKPYLDIRDDSNPGKEIAQKISVLGSVAFPALLTALHDENPYVRAGAAYTFSLIYSFGFKNLKSLSSDLIPALKDSETEVRRNTAYALGAMKDEKAVGPLIELFQDEDKKVRKEAVTALSKIGPASIKPLMESLPNKDAHFRASVAEALGQFGDPSSVGLLCSLLKDDDIEVQIEAARALGFSKNNQTIELLLAVLKNGDPAVRSAAVLSLGKIGDKRAVKPLLDALKDNDIKERRSIASALGDISDNSAVPALIDEGLHDTDVWMSCRSASALGKIKDERAVKPLIVILEDVSSNTKAAAALEALANIGNPQAIQPSIDRLASGSGEMWYSAKFIVKYGEPAVKPLIAALSSENANVRERAAWILGEIGNKQAVDPLILVLKDKNENVRRTTIEVLGKFKDEKTVEPLIRALEVSNPSLSWKTVDALLQIGLPSASAIIDALKNTNPGVRKYAAITLGRLKTPYAVESLIGLLDDEDQDVRKEVVRALGAITGYGPEYDKEKWLKFWFNKKEKYFKQWEDDLKKQAV